MAWRRRYTSAEQLLWKRSNSFIQSRSIPLRARQPRRLSHIQYRLDCGQYCMVDRWTDYSRSERGRCSSWPIPTNSNADQGRRMVWWRSIKLCRHCSMGRWLHRLFCWALHHVPEIHLSNRLQYRHIVHLLWIQRHMAVDSIEWRQDQLERLGQKQPNH